MSVLLYIYIALMCIERQGTKLESINNQPCYIASVNTKRDWLICSHVALDKCNVSRPGNK